MLSVCICIIQDDLAIGNGVTEKGIKDLLALYSIEC